MTIKRKRRRTGADRPIDYDSFSDDGLVSYLDNLAYYVKKGDRTKKLQLYEAAHAVAKKRGINVQDARPNKFDPIRDNKKTDE